MGRSVLRALFRGGRAGLVIGTMYFLVLGILVVFGAALGSGSASLPWLVLFVGAGAGCGLLLGVAAGGAVAGSAAWLQRRAQGEGAEPSTARTRLWGAVAAGSVVLVLCVLADVTGVPGLLSPEPMTSVVLPTLVAAWGGAAAAPGMRP